MALRALAVAAMPLTEHFPRHMAALDAILHLANSPLGGECAAILRAMHQARSPRARAAAPKAGQACGAGSALRAAAPPGTRACLPACRLRPRRARRRRCRGPRRGSAPAGAQAADGACARQARRARGQRGAAFSRGRRRAELGPVARRLDAPRRTAQGRRAVASWRGRRAGVRGLEGNRRALA